MNAENSRLKNQFKTQEDDREYLIKQLVAAKKDNARLRQDLNRSREDTGALQSELEEYRIKATLGGAATGGWEEGRGGDTTTVGVGNTSGQHSPLPSALDDTLVDATGSVLGATGGSAGVGGGLGPAEENRYRDVILRLKKLLDAERKSCRQVSRQPTFVAILVASVVEMSHVHCTSQRMRQACTHTAVAALSGA